jgi:hypothetical protein
MTRGEFIDLNVNVNRSSAGWRVTLDSRAPDD